MENSIFCALQELRTEYEMGKSFKYIVIHQLASAMKTV